MQYDKMTLNEIEEVIGELDEEHCKYIRALMGLDKLFDIDSQWHDLWDEEDPNIDSLCRMIGAVNVPDDLDAKKPSELRPHLIEREAELNRKYTEAQFAMIRKHRQNRTDLRSWINREIERTRHAIGIAEPTDPNLNSARCRVIALEDVIEMMDRNR